MNLTTSLLVLALTGACAQINAVLDRSPQVHASSQPRAPDRGSTAFPPPLFGDWWYIVPDNMRQTRPPAQGDPCDAVPPFRYESVNTYVPVNVPGAAHGGPSYREGSWYSWYARCFARELDRVGAPLAVLIRERNCPFPFAAGDKQTSPGELAAMLDAVPKLDYLLLDLEPVRGGTPQDVKKNAAEIVRLVRSHPNPRVANAFIGNYEDWPGKLDEAGIWPDRRDRASATSWNWDRDAFYREHFNIAMPAVYPYQVHSRHAHDRIQKGNTAPNARSAIFWAPIERLSAAARHLPPGHLLIPWVSNYVAYDKNEDVYNAPPPPREDLEAIIRHARLRGAYSYMIWTANPDQTDHPTIDHQEYRRLAMDAWTTLDPLFAGDEPRLLNLDTDKVSGVQWSGAIAGDRAWILVSNLGNRSGVTVDLPDLPGLPDHTPPVPRNSHRLFRWRLEN